MFMFQLPFGNVLSKSETNHTVTNKFMLIRANTSPLPLFIGTLQVISALISYQ